MARILAIDYGRKRTGLAATDILQITPGGLCTIPTHTLLTFLQDYLSREDVERIIIGHPRQMNHQESESMRYIRPFLAQLSKAFPHIPVELVDERFTSTLAQRTIREAGIGKMRRQQDKGLVDEVSAVIILQSYLASRDLLGNIGLPNINLTSNKKDNKQMNLPVYLYGHPVLRQMGEDITAEYPNIQTLISNMWDTMYHSEGIGLAAPQIGLPIRLFVIDANPMGEDFPECKGFKRVFINARIVSYSEDKVTEGEGCLSIPGIHEHVQRPNKITIEYVDENFQPHTETFEGFAARVVQHEYDHIDGVLFIDHISAIRKQLIRSKLLNITKGKVRTHYRVVAATSKK